MGFCGAAGYGALACGGVLAAASEAAVLASGLCAYEALQPPAPPSSTPPQNETAGCALWSAIGRFCAYGRLCGSPARQELADGGLRAGGRRR